MKIILLTLLALYALAMLGASLYSRRLGLASPWPGLFLARFGAIQPDDLRPAQRPLSTRQNTGTPSLNSWRPIPDSLASLLADLSKEPDFRIRLFFLVLT